MQYPTFFDQAPVITMRDPLAALLGAADDGLIDYRYIDAVRLAGHSCPTVAGAYLMARAAMITGAAAANGFHGIAGQFARQSLLQFSTPAVGPGLRVHRTDTGEGVSVELDMSDVPAPTNLRPLLGAALDPQATPQQRAAFGQAWQARVKSLLLEHADDPEVIRVTRLN